MFHFSRLSRILISASLGVLAGNLLFLLLPYVPSAGRIISSATASFGGDTKFLILYSLFWSILGGITGAFVWKRTKDAGAVSPNRPKTGFTLIELLVVVAIVAILAIVVVYTINPVELFRRARDSTRLSDLDAITKAISIYQTDVSSGSLGVASTTYISIPDPAATTTAGTDCTSLGLPSPPSGWSWHCAASSTYRNTDGTGWIPLNFKQISFGSPIGVLPVDPVNTTSTGEYYTYTTGGSYKLTSRFESEKYTPQAGTDGGPDPALYEVGSNKDLAPFVGGLVGWWKFDETGTTAYDSSGYGNNGTMYSSTTISDLHTSSNCQVGSGCGSFDGVDDYVTLYTLPKPSLPITISLWVKPNTGASIGIFDSAPQAAYVLRNYGGGSVEWWESNPSVPLGLSAGNWYHLVVVFRQTTVNVIDYYRNGVLVQTAFGSSLSGFNWSQFRLGDINFGVNGHYNGLIDDLRIYNRALSAAEVQAIYNARE